MLRIADVDDSGQAWAVPERWEADTPQPRLRVQERGKGALGVGDRILARTEERGNGIVALPMKKLLKGSELVLGVVHKGGRALLAEAGREEGAARVVHFRSRRGAAGRSGAGGEDRPAAAHLGAGRCDPRRSVRATQLQPDRDPQIRHSA